MLRRPPVLLQMSATECGAACLAMVLSYFGRATTVSECHEMCGAGRDGATAKSIADAARAAGLSVRAFRAEPRALGHLSMPAIAHVGFNHFIVVERANARHATVIDPTGGRHRMGLDTLEEEMTGVVLTFGLTAAFAPRRGATTAPWGRHALAALRGKGVLASLGQVLLASLLQHGAGLCVPAFTVVLFDRLIPANDRLSINTALLGLVLLVASQALLHALRGVVLSFAQARLDATLMLGFFRHLLSLPLRYFEERTSGDLMMRLAGNTAVRDLLGHHLLGAVLDVLFVGVYFTLLFTLSPAMGAVALCAALAQACLLWISHRSTAALVYQELSAQAASQGYLIEALKGVRTLKASGAEARAIDHWGGLFRRAARLSLRRAQRSAALDSALHAVRLLAPLLLLWVGARLVMARELTIGGVWALTAIAAAALGPLASLVESAQKLTRAAGEIARIAEALASEPEQHDREVRAAPPIGGAIELRDVSFRYAKGSPEVLSGVSFRAPPGSKVALVGRTGSGKSTLLSLLLGLHEPTSGTIDYDGHPLATLKYETVRRQLGVVTQEVFLFAGSIRDNIAFNDPALSPEEVERAARLAALHDDIVGMPMGYETLVGEGGIALSGGQRQRLALARALASRPSILVLDEATSQLDGATEAEIARSIEDLRCTRVVVAHRLSTIAGADMILVLDKGRIVERGTHEALLEKGGAYAALAATQGLLGPRQDSLAAHRHSSHDNHSHTPEGEHNVAQRDCPGLEEQCVSHEPHRGATRRAAGEPRGVD